jgi:hypothetical protein
MMFPIDMNFLEGILELAVSDTHKELLLRNDDKTFHLLTLGLFLDPVSQPASQNRTTTTACDHHRTVASNSLMSGLRLPSQVHRKHTNWIRSHVSLCVSFLSFCLRRTLVVLTRSHRPHQPRRRCRRCASALAPRRCSS